LRRWSPRLLPLLFVLALPAWLVAALAIALPNQPDSLKFAVIGDSGSGTSQQYQTAQQLTAAYKLFPFTFVLMLGDNLYGGERASDFEKKFTLPYRVMLEAGVPFYAALGNHDDPAIQTRYKPFNMDGRYYSFRKGPAEFFVLDSSYMTPSQTAWLDKALGDSHAPWKIVYMHHPIYSSGRRHGSDMQLRAFIEPLLVKHGVSVALAGHEHFYERLKPQKDIAYFTAGSAGKLREGNIQHGLLHQAGFDTDLSFMLMEITGDQLHFQVISRLGVTVDQGVVARRTDAASTR
jgi:hypothetical protein